MGRGDVKTLWAQIAGKAFEYLLAYKLFVDDAVVQLCQFAGVPAVGGAYEVTGDTLEGVDVVAVAVRALGEILISILEAAVQAAVAVVVHGAVANVVLVHEVHNLHDGFRVVGGVTVNLYVEDVAGVFILVVRTLNLGLVLGCAVIVHRNVAGIGVRSGRAHV